MKEGHIPYNLTIPMDFSLDQYHFLFEKEITHRV